MVDLIGLRIQVYPPFIPPPPPDPPGTPEEFGRASPKTWELDRKLQFTVEGGRGGEGYLNEEYKQKGEGGEMDNDSIRGRRGDDTEFGDFSDESRGGVARGGGAGDGRTADPW